MFQETSIRQKISPDSAKIKKNNSKSFIYCLRFHYFGFCCFYKFINMVLIEVRVTNVRHLPNNNAIAFQYTFANNHQTILDLSRFSENTTNSLPPESVRTGLIGS